MVERPPVKRKVPGSSPGCPAISRKEEHTLQNQITINEMLGDESNPEYDAFVEKFKPKLTTDDC